MEPQKGSPACLTRSWKLQMEATEMFPNVPAYPESSRGWDQMSKGRGSFSKRLLAGREATAWELQEAGDPPVDCEVVVIFGTI